MKRPPSGGRFSLQIEISQPRLTKQIGAVGLAGTRVRHAVALLADLAAQVGSRDVQAIHDHVPCTKAVDGGRKRGRNLRAVYIDDHGRFPGIVEALADADAEECWILFHQGLRYLLLCGDCLGEHGGSERWKRAGLCRGCRNGGLWNGA